MDVSAAIEVVQGIHRILGAPAATAKAAKFLNDGVITTSDYLYLVRWSEGRDNRSATQWINS